MIKLELTEAEFMWILCRLNAETSEGVFEEMYCNVPFDPSGTFTNPNPWLTQKFSILRPLATKLKEAQQNAKV